MTTNRIPKTTKWGKLPQWAWKLGLRANVNFIANADSRTHWTQETAGQAPQDCPDINAAQVITSAVEYPERTGMHKPVLDIDFPAQLIPSSTPGHFHLYLDKELPWDKYQRLLKALAEAGIIEEGYYGASVARGYTALRLPWVRKEDTPDQPRPAAADAHSRPAATPSGPVWEQLSTAARAEALAAVAAADPILENIARAEARDAFAAPPVRPRRVPDRAFQYLRPPASNATEETVAYSPIHLDYRGGGYSVSIAAIRREGIDGNALRGMSVDHPTWMTLATQYGRRINRNGPDRPGGPMRGLDRDLVVIDEDPQLPATATVDAIMTQAEERSRRQQQMMNNMRFATDESSAAISARAAAAVAAYRAPSWDRSGNIVVEWSAP